MIDTKNRKELFPLYAYSGPTDGTYEIDGVKYSVGEDFRTCERVAEYRGAGFNILLFQGNDPYLGEEWISSQTKHNLDLAEKEDLSAIIFDKRITDLCFYEQIIGDDAKFKSFNELVEFIGHCVKDYRTHKAFYGLQLRDEPPCKYLQTIGKVYRAIKTIIPDAFVQVNLLPMNKSAINSFPETKDGKLETRYTAYLNSFLDNSGADYVLYDNYPFLDEDGHRYIRPDHIPGLLTAESVVKERGISFYFIAQSCSMNINGKSKMRKPSDSDMYWQINLLLGFGIKQIAYFTYWRKQVNSTKGEFFPDDGSTFISQNGNKNPIYYVMRDVHSRLQKFAPIYNKFSFEKCSVFALDDELTEYVPNIFEKLTAINSLLINKGNGLFVSELKDNDGNLLYLFLNINDPETSKNADIKFSVAFSEKYEEFSAYSIDDDLAKTFNIKDIVLKAGRGVFISADKKDRRVNL